MTQDITDLARRAETALTVEQATRHIAQAQAEDRARTALAAAFEWTLGTPAAFDRTVVTFFAGRFSAQGFVTIDGRPLVFALMETGTLFVRYICP